MNAVKYPTISRFKSPVDNSVTAQKLSREALYQRHRLSHQQINDFLKEQQNDLVLEEKIHQLKKVACFLEITSALQKANIWFVPLKGPLLSYRIYGDATLRRFLDVDILVKQPSITQAIKILQDIGYTPQSFNWPSHIRLQKMVISNNNQFVMFHPEKPIVVEIHWRLFKYPIIDYEKMNLLTENNIQKINFAGKEYNHFAIEFELIHLIIHGGLHAWKDLKWLFDISEIVKCFHIDKRKFKIMVVTLHAQRMVGLCNALLQHFIPNTIFLPINYSVPEWFIRYSLNQIYKNNTTTNNMLFYFFKNGIFRIYSFPGFSYKIKASNLFTYSPKDLNHIPPFPILYILYRPIGYIYKCLSQFIRNQAITIKF